MNRRTFLSAGAAGLAGAAVVRGEPDKVVMLDDCPPPGGWIESNPVEQSVDMELIVWRRLGDPGLFDRWEWEEHRHIVKGGYDGLNEVLGKYDGEFVVWEFDGDIVSDSMCRFTKASNGMIQSEEVDLRTLLPHQLPPAYGLVVDKIGRRHIRRVGESVLPGERWVAFCHGLAGYCVSEDYVAAKAMNNDSGEFYILPGWVVTNSNPELNWLSIHKVS